MRAALCWAFACLVLSTGGVAGYCPPGTKFGCFPDGRRCTFSKNASSLLPTCPPGYLCPTVYYGCFGELFNASGVLYDWGNSGFAMGEKEPPPRPSFFVVNYGAKPNDGNDDTDAIQRCINAAKKVKGRVVLPPGRFILSKILSVDADVVLSGAGSSRTTLFFTKSLCTILKRPQGTFIYMPGLLQIIGGGIEGRQLANVTFKALRGTRRVCVTNIAKIQNGSLIQILQDDINGAFMSHLLSAPAPARLRNQREPTFFVARVTKKRGNCFEINRPLPWDVNPAWKAQVRTFSLRGSSCGVEGLKIEYGYTQFPGRWAGYGLNGLYVWQVQNAYFRDLLFVNFDTSLAVSNSASVTIKDVKVTNTKPRARGLTVENCLAAIVIKRSVDVLVSKVTVDTTCAFDFRLIGHTSGVVVSDSSGKDLSMCHDVQFSIQSLWTGINVGNGTRMWCELSGVYSFVVSSRTTYWNIQSKSVAKIAPLQTGNNLNLVAFKAVGRPAATWNTRYMFVLNTYPPNVHTNMQKVTRATTTVVQG